MKISANVTGSNALAITFSRIGRGEGLRATLQAAAEDVRDAAKDNLFHTRHKSRLASSLEITPGADGFSFSISTPLDYGWHLEFGTLNRPPRPWLLPALDAARPSVERRMSEWLEGIVGR
jgi:hypothetical protein